MVQFESPYCISKYPPICPLNGQMWGRARGPAEVVELYVRADKEWISTRTGKPYREVDY